MAPPTKKSSKPIFKTSSPFTDTIWPSVGHEDQEVITDLLYNLLTPLGEHRKTRIQPSKGKKRKRATVSPEDDVLAPPKPLIGSHILIGLNSVTRHLETLATRTAPSTALVRGNDANEGSSKPLEHDVETKAESAPEQISMVILTHPQPSLSPSHAHIPTLVQLANLSPKRESEVVNITRLIALPTSNDARFASALHIPRVGAIAVLEGAPGAKALENYVKQHVGLTECLWVEEALKPEWTGLNVEQA